MVCSATNERSSQRTVLAVDRWSIVQISKIDSFGCLFEQPGYLRVLDRNRYDRTCTGLLYYFMNVNQSSLTVRYWYPLQCKVFPRQMIDLLLHLPLGIDQA